MISRCPKSPTSSIADHREVEDMFHRLMSPGAPCGNERRALVDRVIIELVRHAVTEEAHLYPAARRYLPDGDAVADREIDDHNEVERLMKDLENLDTDDPRFEHTLARLIADVRAHVEDEETRLFPSLREHTTRTDRTMLGGKVQAAKASAPTRPHPKAPSTAPAITALAPGIGLVDRARDACTGRGR
ncbi:MAG: hemerythrin domain-containing protein [Nocardiopsaceae bacterium]|nr:hemerythrin domain-containing protein [Nocardiopsaceae bacterium]